MSPDDTNIGGANPATGPDAALVKQINRLLVPLARLCLAHGLTAATVETLLRQAFVHEAHALEPHAKSHGTVSRISTATGLTRREVGRILKSEAPARAPKRSLGAEVVARWTTDPLYKEEGVPRALKRQGPPPSFEALARSITRDVHPRSMLDELVRQGGVLYDAENDTVSLAREEFVPNGDAQHMLDLLGDNVGDHLSAAVANVLNRGTMHLEQAVFADELSTESAAALRQVMMDQWKALRDTLVPRLLEMIDADRAAGRRQDQRIRIGLYTFGESTESPDPEPAPTAAKRRVYRRKGA